MKGKQRTTETILTTMGNEVKTTDEKFSDVCLELA